MKKTIFLSMILVLVLSGCVKKNPKTEIQKSMEKAQKQIYGNKPTKCTYEIDGQKMTAYIKQGKMRSEMGEMQTINDGEYIYSWSSQTKAGSKMSLAIMAENGSERQEKAEMPSKEELEDMAELINKMQEEMKADCKQENFSNSVFDVPTDVAFTDMDEQMKQMREMSGKFQNMEGQDMGSEDAKKMMEEAGEIMKSFGGSGESQSEE